MREPLKNAMVHFKNKGISKNSSVHFKYEGTSQSYCLEGSYSMYQLETMGSPVSQTTPKESSQTQRTNIGLVWPLRTNSGLAWCHRTNSGLEYISSMRELLKSS